MEPIYFLLGIVPEDFLESNQTKMLRSLLLIANKVITASWLKPHPPTIAQWRDRVQDMYHIEHVTAVLQLKLESFFSDWAGIVIHLHLI